MILQQQLKYQRMSMRMDMIVDYESLIVMSLQ